MRTRHPIHDFRARHGDAQRHARRNALRDANHIRFDAGVFDLVVCKAAFKNFMKPVIALDEMHRVLRGGGVAVIQDMTKRASHSDIEKEVSTMDLGRLNTFMTKATLEMLRRRAYSPAQFERLVAESAFQTCVISTAGIGLEVRLTKSAKAGALPARGLESNRSTAVA